MIVLAVSEGASAWNFFNHYHHHVIDLGWVNGHYFFNVTHIGLGANVTHALLNEIKQRWGALNYARAVVNALRTNRPFWANIECDGFILRTRAIDRGQSGCS